MDNQIGDNSCYMASSDVQMENFYSNLENCNSGRTDQTTRVENASCFRKWRFCLLGTIIGIVCSLILGIGIGLVVNPYLISQDTYPAITRKVAFHSTLSNDTSLDFEQTVIFDEVITNFGEPYNNNTGIFTAPVDGVYVFLSTFIKRKEAKALHLTITKNQETVSRGHATYGKHWNEGSMNAVLVLDKNDQVTVSHMASYGKEEKMFGKWCFFSGYLLM